MFGWLILFLLSEVKVPRTDFWPNLVNRIQSFMFLMSYSDDPINLPFFFINWTEFDILLGTENFRDKIQVWWVMGCGYYSVQSVSVQYGNLWLVCDSLILGYCNITPKYVNTCQTNNPTKKRGEGKIFLHNLQCFTYRLNVSWALSSTSFFQK